DLLLVSAQVSSGSVLVIEFQQVPSRITISGSCQSHDLACRLASRIEVIDKVVSYRRLLGTDHRIGRQGTKHEQQDEPKTECKLVGNLQIGKPTQHRISPDKETSVRVASGS